MSSLAEKIRLQSQEIQRRAEWIEAARKRLWERMDRLHHLQEALDPPDAAPSLPPTHPAGAPDGSTEG